MSITETSMYKYLMQNYNEKKDAVAMSFLHKKFTYGFLSDEIDRIACFLKNQGIEKGYNSPAKHSVGGKFVLRRQ